MALAAFACACAFLAAPGGALAGLHNAIPFDASEDPADSFNDNDALFAYTTSDIKGGYVCAVHVNAPPDVGCGAGWAKTRIVGIGSSIDLIAFAGGLPAGNWRLETVDSEEQNGEAGGEFTVEACPLCDNSISASAAAQAKAAAKSTFEAMEIGCVGLTIKDMGVTGGSFAAARGALKKLGERKGDYTGGLGFIATAAGSGLGGFVLGFELPSLSNPGEEKALEILRELTCALTEMYTDIYNDPPDPQFFTVGSPSFNTLPTGLPSSGLLTALDRQGAFGETMLKSYERYQGAKAAAQKPFVHAQSNAVFENGFAQLSEITATVKALRAEATRMDGLPAFDGAVATAASKADLTSLYTRVKNDGFTIGETAQLVGLGLTAAQIGDLRNQFSLDLSSFPVDTTLPAILRSTADALASTGPGFDEFLRSAGTSAGRANVAPVAAFTATPDNGPAPLTVHFTDTSTSSDLDPLTRQWDFGDGSTATGASVDHTYTHALNYAATLTVSDDLLSNSVSHTIHVSGTGGGGPNTRPTAVDDTLVTPFETQGTVGVLANDSDPDGDALTVSSFTSGAHGSVTCVADTGTCSYTPAPGYTGADQFTYTASDGRGGTATASVAVTVQPVAGTPPNANTDNLVLLAGGSASVNVLLNDTDQNNDPLTVTAFTQGTYGTVSCTTAGLCTYTATGNEVGSDGFTYTVSDGGNESVGFVQVQLKTTNLPPHAADDAASTRVDVSKVIDVLANDTDPDFDGLRVVSATTPAHGTVNCPDDGNCRYTPGVGYTGPDSFSYVMTDGISTDGATVSITVTPNAPPVATDDVAKTKHDKPVTITVLANDTDPDSDGFEIIAHSAATHGTVDCTPAFCIYTPAPAFVGEDAFTYTVSDGRDASSAAVAVTVTPNTPPVAVDDVADAIRGVPVYISVENNDSDGDSDALTIQSATTPAHGTVDCLTVICTYTSDSSYTGPDGFDYTITDGEATATAHVTVDVRRPCFPAVCIDNGTMLLAVQPAGQLNVDNGAGSKAGQRQVGLYYLPTQHDSTAPGCLCEGWGAADAKTGVTGYANQATDDGANHMTVESFTFTDSTAISVVNIENTLRVTQNYHPSTKTPNLYEDTVTIENISGGPLDDIRYRRVMDWDIEPTAFSEYVTIEPGNASELLYDDDNGFQSANPLADHIPFCCTGRFTDQGPADHGALFDFGFGALDTAKSKTFNIFYGAAGNEEDAKQAVNAVGAEVYSFGQPSTEDGPTLGTPNTFIFAFGNVGGTAIFTPNAVDDSLSTNVATPGTVNVLANDTDPNGDTLTVSAFTQGAHGTVSCLLSGLCTYTPNPGYAGPDSFTYTANDGNGGTDTATVSVTVVQPNRAPTCVAASLTTPQDTPLSGQLSCGDLDANTLAYALVGAAGHGTVTVALDGHFTYTPAAGYTGPDSFTFKANDGTVDSPVTTASIAVTPVNHAPVAQDGSATTDQDTAVGITLHATDADGDPLSYAIVTGPAHGSLGGTGTSRTYTPNAGYSGPDSFTFKANDGSVDSNTATITITVRHTNHAPVATDGSATTDQDTPVAVTLHATDPDGDPLIYAILSGPSHGSLSGTGANRTYTPDAGYVGPDSVTFRAFDGTADSNTATITITVRNTNHAPIAQDGSATTDEDTAVVITLHATDADGDPLTYAIVAGPAHGSLSGTGANRTYTPAAGYFGPDSFTFKANDGTSDSNTGTISVTVQHVNHAPVAADGSAATDQDTAVGITLHATDPDGDSLTYAVTSGPAHGTLSGTGTNRTYTPAAGYFGPDSFTFMASDGLLGSNTATISITVKHVNHAPAATDDSATTDQDTAVAITLHATDPDGDPLTYAIVTSPAHGSLSGTGANRTYTPAAGYFGPDSFTFKANDGTADSNTATISVAVRHTNRAPHADDGSATTDEDTAVTIALHATDADGDLLTYAIVTGPAHGSLSGTGANRTYTPAPNYFGPDSFTFKANDGTVDSNTATITIAVAAVPDAPVALDSSVATDEDTAVGITLGANDADGDVLSFTILSAPAHGTLLGSGATRTYLPQPNYNGPDSLTFRANDGALDSNVATVSITVRPVNDPPVCVDLALTVEHATPGEVAPSCTDVDNAALTITLASQGSKGVASIVGGKLHYEPGATSDGADSFTYRASDGTVESAPATVNVTIKPAATPKNDPPVCTDSTASTQTTTPLNGAVHCTDADNDALTYALATGVTHGTLTFKPDGTFHYVAAAGFIGLDSFTYTAADGHDGVGRAMVTITVVPVADTTPPSCRFAYAGMNAYGKKVIDATTRDTGSGLASIRVLRAENATVQMPRFAVGATGSIVVHTTEIDAKKPNEVELELKDVAGNTTVCDPIVTTLTRPAHLKAGAKPTRQTFVGVPFAESKLRLTNGEPGLTRVDVVVNGRLFKLGALRPGAKRFVDLTSAMRPGRGNTIVLRPYGPRGATATIFVADR